MVGSNSPWIPTEYTILDQEARESWYCIVECTCKEEFLFQGRLQEFLEELEEVRTSFFGPLPGENRPEEFLPGPLARGPGTLPLPLMHSAPTTYPRSLSCLSRPGRRYDFFDRHANTMHGVVAGGPGTRCSAVCVVWLAHWLRGWLMPCWLDSCKLHVTTHSNMKPTRRGDATLRESGLTLRL